MGRLFRLVVAERHWHSGQLAGLFVAAYRLKRDVVLTSLDRSALKGLLRWFERNLPIPRRVTGRAICWFKGTANPCSRRIWDLA
jgi:hypothetical protein